MKKPEAPCLDCEKRYVGCHDKCDAYQDFKRLSAIYTETIKSIKINDIIMNEVEKQRFEKYNRNKRYNEKKGAYD